MKIKSIWAWLGRSLFLTVCPILRFYFKSHATRRTRLIVSDQSGQIVLVKGWFSRQCWELPGGGIKPGEDPARAASRELKEETGLSVKAENLQFLGEFLNVDAATPYMVMLYHCKIDQIKPFVKGRPWEILQVTWQSPKRLSTEVSPLVVKALRRKSEVD